MSQLKNISIRRLLFISLCLASAIPVLLLAFWIQHSAYMKEVDAVKERHLIIARNLTGALERYATDVRSGFRMAAFFSEQQKKPAEIYSLLDALHFKHIWQIDNNGAIQPFLTIAKHEQHLKPSAQTMELIAPALKRASADPERCHFSRVFIGHSGEALICIVKVLKQGRFLLGQIGTEYFQKVQREVAFGQRGHAAIVDQFGNTIAHPAEEWRSSARDITFLPPVARMVAGETGVSQFYTPAMDADMIAGFSTVDDVGWGVMIPQPLSELKEKANHLRFSLLTTALLVILIGGGSLALLLARKLSSPIEQLNLEMARIRDFDLKAPKPVISDIREIKVMADTVESMKNGLKAFHRYVPADLVRQLIASGQEAVPGGEEKELTLFFSDVANFTSISEQIPARELMIELSEYLELMTEKIAAEQGTIDKFIGDGIMAFWGAPVDDQQHARHACRAALNCQRALQVFNEKRRAKGRPAMETRIGLHTGFTIVGNMGSEDRLNFSAVGDTVNLASRLEGANKTYNSKIIISQATFSYVQNDFIIRPLDLVTVQGKRNSVMIYELMGDKSLAERLALEELACRSREAFECYLDRKWFDAYNIFSALLRDYPDDVPSAMFIKRCKKLIATDPGPEWSGTVRLPGAQTLASTSEQ